MSDRTRDSGFAARRTVLLLGVWIWLASCQSTTRIGDRYYDKGRFPEAAAAFQVYLDSEPTDDGEVARTLYRMGLIYALPDTGAYDPMLSVATLERLMEEYPDSAYTVDARLLRDLQMTVMRLDREFDALREELAAAEAELAERTASLAALRKQLDGREREIVALEESIPPLQGEIRALIRELASRERELEQLEQLKAIDLSGPPP